MTTTPLKEKIFPEEEKHKLPKVFVMRRLHSLMGLWLVIYLFEHLLVNSQAALFLQDDGHGFVAMVNKIHNIPYLKVVEILFLAVPFLIHGAWGMLYARTSRSNSWKTDGHNPSLPQYVRNRAFTWQRITAWILVVGILAHVIQMRFVDAPILFHKGIDKNYIVKLQFDPGLYSVADKLNVTLYNEKEIQEEEKFLESQEERLKHFEESLADEPLEESPIRQERYYKLKEDVESTQEWMSAIKQKGLKKQQILAIAPNAGTAFLLVVRDIFKSPLMVILYTILVLTACYHGFNGLWTFLIAWGATLTRRSQAFFRKICQALFVIVTIMGLMAAWGTYFIVQFQG